MKSTDFFIPLNKIASMKIRYQPNQDFDGIIGVGDAVKVAVLGVDLKKKKISLTMKGIKE